MKSRRPRTKSPPRAPAGFESEAAFLEQVMHEKPHNAHRLMKVARFASPAAEERYTSTKLSAALGTIEAKLGAPYAGLEVPGRARRFACIQARPSMALETRPPYDHPMLRRIVLALASMLIGGCGDIEIGSTEASVDADTGADFAEASDGSLLNAGDVGPPKMPPDGAAQCGYASLWCDPLTQWCEDDGVGSPDPNGGTCEPLPAPCVSQRTCSCLLDASSRPCISCVRLDSGLLLAGCWEP